MSKYHLTPFNELDLNKLDENYEAEIEYDRQTIEVSLNFDGNIIKKEKLIIIEKFLFELKKYDEKALAAIAKDFKTGDTVKDYIDHHVRELNDDEQNTLLKNSDKNFSIQQQMAAILHLNRVRFYPDNTDNFAIFEYTISKMLTGYLIVVEFTHKGKIEGIIMES